MPRSKTPAHAADAVVQASTAVDATEPQAAPAERSAPLLILPPALAGAGGPRSRKETLVSPIPALLAAQMGEIIEECDEDRGEATPLHADLPLDSTSRLDPSSQEALLSSDEEEYVVEVDPVSKV